MYDKRKNKSNEESKLKRMLLFGVFVGLISFFFFGRTLFSETENKTVLPQESKITPQELSLPFDAPSFVKIEHVEKIDWNGDTPSKTRLQGTYKEVSAKRKNEEWIWSFQKKHGNGITILAVEKDTNKSEKIILNEHTLVPVWSTYIENEKAKTKLEFSQKGIWALLVYVDTELRDIVLYNN